MKRHVLPLLLLAAPAAAVAQGADVRERVLRAQPPRFEAGCKINAGHFRVRGAGVYIRTSTENEANRERLLNDAVTTLTEAITQNDQANNGAAWYYLGRANLYQGDIVGADTALSRAEALLPECVEEITSLRRASWASLLEPALLLAQENKADSAVAVYRWALRIYRGEPQAFFQMASIFDVGGQTDSAIVYLRRTLTAPGGPSETQARYTTMAVNRLAGLYAVGDQPDSAIVFYERAITLAGQAQDFTTRDLAAQQIARLQFEAKRYPEAVQAFRRLLEWRPGDEPTLRNLATVYQVMGQADSARAIMARLGIAAPRVDSTSPAFLVNRGVGAYQAKNYAAAAADFGKALEAEPSNRIALVNLGHAYVALEDGASLVKAAERALAREPMHELSHRFLVQGYVFLKDQAKAQAAVKQLDALPVMIDSLALTSSGAEGQRLTGVAIGRQGATPAPMTLVFELLGPDGAVVGSAEQAIPALAAGATHRIAIAAGGASDWRYRKK